MKTSIQFLHAASGRPDACGETLEIEESSRALGWDGVLVEVGSAQQFHPTEVTTREFYFALDRGTNLHWTAQHDGHMQHLITQPGEIWVNPPSVPFTHVVSEPCQFAILTIDQATMLRGITNPQMVRQLQFLNSYNVSDPVLTSCIEALVAELRTGGRSGLTFVNHVVGAFAEYYIRHYSNYRDLIADGARQGRLSESDVAAVQQFFLSHIDRGVGVEEAAQLVGMSKFTFLREFKRTAGLTPYQYFLKLRTERAAELLRGSEAPIAEVAYAVGFSDQSHFTNVFKRRYGVSPGRYRRSER